MKTKEALELGEVVVAAFDQAAEYSTDPREVSWLASRAVMRVLRRAANASRTPR